MLLSRSCLEPNLDWLKWRQGRAELDFLFNLTDSQGQDGQFLLQSSIKINRSSKEHISAQLYVHACRVVLGEPINMLERV